MSKKNDIDEELEQPVLELDVSAKEDLPKEIPDVFEDAEYEEVVDHEQDIELKSLFNDIEVFLKIDDVESAKREYKKLLKIFNHLPVERKKEYFDRVNKMYDEIKNPMGVQKEFEKSLK